MCALAAAILSACATNGSGSRLSLPQRFRMSESQLSTFLEARSGRIAIVRNDGNVMLTDQTGSVTVTLTSDAGTALARDRSSAVSARYVLPIWSPDASRLALLELRSAQPLTQETTLEGLLGVFVQAQPGSRMQEQTLGGAISHDITDAEQFAFEPRRVTLEFAGRHMSSALYTVSPNGPGPLKEILYSEEPIEYVDWSPIGDSLGVLTRGKDAQTLTVVASDGSRRQSVAEGVQLRWNWNADGEDLLTQTRSGVTVRKAVTGEKVVTIEAGGDASVSSQFSPDGKMLAIARYDGTETALVLADRNGVEQRTIAKVRGEVHYAWSPKGDALAFIAREDGRLGGALRIVNTAAGEPQLLSSAPVVGFFWSPDGTRIASFSPLELGLMSSDDNTPSAVSEDSANPMLVQTIEVAQGAAGARKVLYMDPSRRFLALLVDFDRYNHAVTIWSPNSRRLVVPFSVGVGQGGGVDYVAEMEASGSIWPRVLGEGSLAVWSPR